MEMTASIGSLVWATALNQELWALTKVASDREGAFDWRQVTGDTTGRK